jgi:adenylate cyclase class IV
VKPQMPGFYVELKARTWSLSDAQVKANYIDEMLDILKIDRTQTLPKDYLELHTQD